MNAASIPWRRTAQIALGCLVAWQVSVILLTALYALTSECDASPSASCLERVPATVVDHITSIETNGRHVFKLSIRADNGDVVNMFHALGDGIDRASFSTADLNNPGFYEDERVTLYRWHGEYIKLGTGDNATKPMIVNLDEWSPVSLWLVLAATIPITAFLAALSFWPPDKLTSPGSGHRSVTVLLGIFVAFSVFVVWMTGGQSVVVHMYSVFL